MRPPSVFAPGFATFLLFPKKYCSLASLGPLAFFGCPFWAHFSMFVLSVGPKAFAGSDYPKKPPFSKDFHSGVQELAVRVTDFHV